MNETWKDLAGYEALYQVSDLGQVRSVQDGKVRILKPRSNNKGYLQVELCRNGKPKNKLVHRLVAQAFIPNPSNLPQVNHKDENPKNNVVSNLEWCTQKYNVNYGTRNSRVSAKLKGRAAERFVNGPRSKAVLQFDKSGNLVKEWLSMHEVERQTGFAQSNISACCRGKYKSAYGYVWKFK